MPHLLRHRLARNEMELVGVLTMKGGFLHVQHKGELVACIIQDELCLELKDIDTGNACRDVGGVVHPPPVVVVIVVVSVVVVVAVDVVVGGGGGWWWCMVVVVPLIRL